MSSTDEQVAWARLWDALRAARRGETLIPTATTDDMALALAQTRGVRGLAERGLGLPSTQHVERSRAGRGTMKWVHELLTRADVEHAFFKGPFADGVLWGGHGDRGFTDVDVLIAPKDEGRAISALEQVRFKKAPMPSLRASVAAGKARVLLAPNPLFMTVDLHRRPLNDPPFPARSEAVFESLRTYDTRDGPMPGPCPEHMIVWSAGNLAGGRLQGIVAQAADAAAWVEREGFDWDVVVRTASLWRARACTYGLLRLIAARLGARVPPEVLAALAPPAFVAALIERVFGVTGAPLEHTTGLKGLLGVEWPLTGRLSWPVRRTVRLLRLRIANAALAPRKRG